MPARHVWVVGAVTAVVIAGAGSPDLARACATCNCGDPTLTTMGVEKPFAGRLRVSAEVRAQRATTGEADVDRVRRAGAELDLGVAWSPLSWLTATVAVPLIVREASFMNEGRDRGVSVGDIEVRGKAVVWRDRGFAPTKLLAVTAGLKAPTAPQLDDGGVPLNDDAQSGTGSWDPLAGLAYSQFLGSTTFYASATVIVPTRGWDDRRVGTALASSIALQLQPAAAWAVVLGADSRLEAVTDRAGQTEADTGGFVAYASPRIVWSPVTDLLLHVRVSIPVVQAVHGDQHEGPIIALGATLDL